MEAYAMYFIDLILHLDKHLPEIMMAYGHLIYAILFMVVFCETGLVVTPFLPGDSLLFACGALAAAAPEGMDIKIIGCAGRRLQLYDRRASRYAHD